MKEKHCEGETLGKPLFYGLENAINNPLFYLSQIFVESFIRLFFKYMRAKHWGSHVFMASKMQ